MVTDVHLDNIKYLLWEKELVAVYNHALGVVQYSHTKLRIHQSDFWHEGIKKNHWLKWSFTIIFDNSKIICILQISCFYEILCLDTKQHTWSVLSFLI